VDRRAGPGAHAVLARQVDSIGLVGFGRLGGFLGRHLSKDFPVLAHDPRPLKAAMRKAGVRPASLQDACARPVVVLCVPIRDLEPLLRRIGKWIRPGALVMDMASVKQRPAALMRALLPKGAEIIAAHPAFGPDSAAAGLKGHKIAFCPVRVSRKRAACVKSYLRKKGLRVVETTPAEHDRQMAGSLVLTHFIGRGLIGYGAGELEMDTEGYKRLMRILQTVQNDSWELFEDMNRFNAYARAVRRGFLDALRAVDRRVERAGSRRGASRVAA
jgi:prephenate dehydrogenase